MACFTSPHHITQHHTILYITTVLNNTSQHVKQYYTRSQHTTPYHTTPHDTTPKQQFASIDVSEGSQLAFLHGGSRFFVSATEFPILLNYKYYLQEIGGYNDSELFILKFAIR